MAFDFEAAVTAPFRMQPGLRRMAPGAPHLTPLAPGSRHQREKLAVLSAFAGQALCSSDGFDPALALDTLFAHAASEHPARWQFDGAAVSATDLGVRVGGDGAVEQIRAGVFGLGDEIGHCLGGLAPDWRRTALLALAFAEDFAIVDAATAAVPWIAAALPSHWAPERKVGRHFAEVHAPVADGELLRRSAEALTRLVSAGERWERFVWTITDHPRLHAHPSRLGGERWVAGSPGALPPAWWRTEHQTFLPVPGTAQACFTIAVDVQPLETAIDTAAKAERVHAALASMSTAVIDYRGLQRVREPLLQWLAARACGR